MTSTYQKLQLCIMLSAACFASACGPDVSQQALVEDPTGDESTSALSTDLVEFSACRSIGRSADSENYCVDSVELQNVEPGKKYYYWMKLSPAATTDVKNVQIRFLDGKNPAETVTFEVGDSKSGQTWRPYIIDKDCTCSVDVIVETGDGPQVVIDSAPVASEYENSAENETEDLDNAAEADDEVDDDEETEPEIIVDPAPVDLTDDTPSPFEEALEEEEQPGEEPEPEPTLALDDYLIAWYPLDGDIQDHSGNGHHAVASGGTYSVDRIGRSAKAYTLDGIDDYLDLGSDIANQNVWSFSMWFKTGADRYAQTMIGNYVSCSYATIGFIVQNWGTSSPLGSKLELRNGQGRNPISNIGYEGNYHDESWHHLVGVFDEASFQLYIDNVMVATATGTYEPTTYPLLVGGANSLCGRDSFLAGSVDDLRIYSIAFDENDVSLLYNRIDP